MDRKAHGHHLELFDKLPARRGREGDLAKKTD